MTREQLFIYCKNTFNTLPDYPFDEDFETAVLSDADSDLIEFLLNVSYEATNKSHKKR